MAWSYISKADMNTMLRDGLADVARVPGEPARIMGVSVRASDCVPGGTVVATTRPQEPIPLSDYTGVYSFNWDDLPTPDPPTFDTAIAERIMRDVEQMLSMQFVDAGASRGNETPAAVQLTHRVVERRLEARHEPEAVEHHERRGAQACVSSRYASEGRARYGATRLYRRCPAL